MSAQLGHSASTVTVNTTAWYAICACCHDHGDRPLASEIVTCTTCGAMCSCEGCVAEAGHGA
jgi:hypothetical protein